MECDDNGEKLFKKKDQEKPQAKRWHFINGREREAKRKRKRPRYGEIERCEGEGQKRRHF